MKSTQLQLIHNSYSEITRERDPEDEWSGEDTRTHHEFKGVKIGEGWDHIYIPGEVKVGDTVHLVIAVRSTGDSFSHHDQKYYEVYSAHRDIETAEQNARILRDWHEDDPGPKELTLCGGTKFVLKSVPWHDIFESLDFVEVYTFTIER